MFKVLSSLAHNYPGGIGGLVFYKNYQIIIISEAVARRCSVENVFIEILESVLRNFEKFTGKHLCQSLFFNEVAGLCEFSKNTFFNRIPPVATVLILLERKVNNYI